MQNPSTALLEEHPPRTSPDDSQTSKMSLSEKNSSCPLFTIPLEVKAIIWDHVLNLHRPVLLVSTEKIRTTYKAKHATNCPFAAYHPYHKYYRRPVSDVSGVDSSSQKEILCIDPFTKKVTKIHIPPSVLAARLVCRAMRRDMGHIFWQANDFHFDTSFVAYLAITRIPLQFTQEIKKLTFRFTSSGASSIFRTLAIMCPNLDTLRLIMHYDHSRLIRLKHCPDATNTPRSALKMASGVPSMRRAITTLRTLQVVGVDQIRLPHPETNEAVLIEVDVNHPNAVGPWLRAGT